MKKLLLLSLLVLSFACGGGPKTYEGTGGCPAGRIPTNVSGICIISNWGDSTTNQVDRPAGGWIFLELSATQEQKALIGQAVEAGLNQTIAGAQHFNPNWTVYGTPDHYGMVMIRKQATNQDGTPALIVSGVQTAGTVINAFGDGNPRGTEPVIVLPVPDTWPPAGDPYWAYLQASARNEGEHVIEYKNDLSEFLRRAIRADIHPHWDWPTGAVALVSPLPSNCLFGGTNPGPAVSFENGRTVVK